MLKERKAATLKVASQLFAAEQAIDNAIREAAKLTSMLPEARVDAKLSAVVGQSAINLTGQSLQQLISARQDIVAAHDELDNVKTDIGLRTLSMGGAVDKTPDRANGHLSVVEDESLAA